MIKKSIMEENTQKCQLFQLTSLKTDYISSTYKVKPHMTKESSKMTLYKHHCVNVLFSENIFYSQINCLTRLMIKMSMDYHRLTFLMIERGNKIYVRNELHSIVVVK